LAFRIAYSLFDKIAVFINTYLELGIRPDRVDIRRLWYDARGRLRPQFTRRKNWHMRGLFWLTQDLAASDPGFLEAIAPNAGSLQRIRNALEHRCLQLVWPDGPDPMGVVESLSLRDFEARCLEILKRARNALLHLSFAVHREEASKEEAFRKEGLIIAESTLPPLRELR